MSEISTSIQVIPSVLTEEQIEYLTTHSEVINGRIKIDNGASLVYFNVPLRDDIRIQLESVLGMNLTGKTSIPMRWIKGDSKPHIDKGQADFDNTYLVYLTNNSGQFIINNSSYTISRNTAFIFNEGLRHETIETGTEPRLLLGAMSEQGFSVGSPIIYFANQADADAITNSIGSSGDYDVDTVGGFSSWRISTVFSNGSSNPALVYNAGDTLNNDGIYYLYPAEPCFLEGSKILCLVNDKETYVPVESLSVGTLVKTHSCGFKKVVLIGKGNVKNPADSNRTGGRLYRCSIDKYPELTEDLYITGYHSILSDSITDKQQDETRRLLGDIFITEGKYRIIACIDERAEPWNSFGTYPIWHFALENSDEYMNYGVYANGGLLVESCNIAFLKSKSNMILTEC